MARTAIFISILLASVCFVQPSHAEKTVAARVAAWVMPEPTLAQIVEASQRVFISESGFVSTADENIIYRVFRTRAGKKRDEPRRQMQVIVAIANRTFPTGSPFVPPGLTARTPRQRWISQVNLECTAPPDWRADVPWDVQRGEHLSYEELCHAQRKRTWRLWQGKTPNWCQGRVDHWGGAMDTANPRRGGWKRVSCDDPSMVEQCEAARQEEPRRHYTWPVGCARNIAWCDPDIGSCSRVAPAA